MKKAVFAFSLLICVFAFAGTKEEIQKLQSDLLLLQKKIEALSVELLNLNKKIEVIENKMDGLQRSSQTADLRVDMDNLKMEVEKLNNAILEMKNSQLYSSLNKETDETSSVAPSIPSGETPEKMYQTAYSDYIQGRYQLAIVGFQKFLETYPEHPLVENCYYWIGECYYGLKDFGQAKAALEKVIKDYPKGAKFYSAKLKLALVHYNLGEKELSKKMLAEIIKESPMSTEAGVAKEKLRTLFQE